MNQKDTHRNYLAAIDLAREVSRTQLASHISVSDSPEEAVEDLAQSIVGTESVVRLIMTLPFDADAYRPVIASAADEVGRLFFPDVQKRFISSIDVLPESALKRTEPPERDSDTDVSIPDISGLPNYLREYLDCMIEREGIEHLTSGIWRDVSIDTLSARLERLRRHYPDGNVPVTLNIDPNRKLDEEQICETARFVGAGLAISFPWGFFARDTEKRIRITVQYLVRHEIQQDPQKLVHDGLLRLVSLGLGPALRRCGGSLNRLLGHAFPGEVRPWMSSHVPTGFWDDAENRKDAIRWLVEERLGISPERIAEAIHDGRIEKSDFADFGLTWLLKEVYRWSVADALNEAYPDLQVWERMRRVPTDMWRGKSGTENAAAAIVWALNRSGADAEDLRHQRAARTVQSALRPWKLTAAFSIGFGRDIVACLNAVYPGRFEPWEISNTPRDDWRDPKLRERAFHWLLDKLGIAPPEIPTAIAQGRLTPASFKDEGLDGLLRVTGSVWRAVDDVYPGRYARWELTSVPRSHWRNRVNVREAVLWTLERVGVRESEAGAAIESGRLDANIMVTLGLGSLIMGVFRGDVRVLCQVADVVASEDYVPLSRYYRRGMASGDSDPHSRRLHRGEGRRESGKDEELALHIQRSRSIRDRRRRRG